MENELTKTFAKGSEKGIIVGRKEITFQNFKKGTIKKRPMPKEQEPRTENKLPICDSCQKMIDILDQDVGYIRYGEKLFHLNCFSSKGKLGKSKT